MMMGIITDDIDFISMTVIFLNIHIYIYIYIYLSIVLYVITLVVDDYYYFARFYGKFMMPKMSWFGTLEVRTDMNAALQRNAKALEFLELRRHGAFVFAMLWYMP